MPAGALGGVGAGMGCGQGGAIHSDPRRGLLGDCHAEGRVSGLTITSAFFQPDHWRRSQIRQDPVAPCQLGPIHLSSVDVELLTNRYDLQYEIRP